jgi:hypothetical protein
MAHRSGSDNDGWQQVARAGLNKRYNQDSPILAADFGRHSRGRASARSLPAASPVAAKIAPSHLVADTPQRFV